MHARKAMMAELSDARTKLRVILRSRIQI